MPCVGAGMALLEVAAMLTRMHRMAVGKEDDGEVRVTYLLPSRTLPELLERPKEYLRLCSSPPALYGVHRGGDATACLQTHGRDEEHVKQYLRRSRTFAARSGDS